MMKALPNYEVPTGKAHGGSRGVSVALEAAITDSRAAKRVHPALRGNSNVWGEDPTSIRMGEAYTHHYESTCILIVLMLLFGGGGFYLGGPMIGGGGFGLILLICLVLFFTGNLGRR